MTWKEETNFNNVKDLFVRLLGLWKKDKSFACRGQADSCWLLQTLLDRHLDSNADYVVRLAEERAIIEKFRILGQEYFGEAERKYIKGSHQNDNIAALTVMQHYRAPTRLLDWTSSPWVALYFAVIHHHDKDGVIWWFQQEAFESKVDKRWVNWYPNRKEKEPVDLNMTAFKTNRPDWITKLHCVVPFQRIEVQQGFFTIAGCLGLEHEYLIADCLDEGAYGRIKIPASWKQEVLDRLRNMNIHSKSLDYPGADLVGSRLKLDLERNHRPESFNKRDWTSPSTGSG